MRPILAGGCLAALASVTIAHAAPAVYAYKGNGRTGLAAIPTFNAWLGRKADGAVDFGDFSTRAAYGTSSAYTIASWKGSGYELVISLPLAFSNDGAGGMEKVVARAYDDAYLRTAQLLVQSGFADAYIRLGWEMNGGWYPWAANGKVLAADHTNYPKGTGAYVAAFQHIVKEMRGQPGQHFRFVWNPATGYLQGNADGFYPGDAFVDVIGLDAYCNTWNEAGAPKVAAGAVAPEPGATASVIGGTWGVGHAVAFAAAHHKPYAFPEFATGTRPDGHGCGDDPAFISAMAPYIAGAAFVGVWDFKASDYDGSVSNGSKPQAAAALKAALATH